MARIQLDLEIDAPIQRVWDLITDLDSQERWMEDVHTLEVIYRTSALEGSVLKVTSKLFGLPLLHDVMVITKVEPPHTLEIIHAGQFSGSGAFRLTQSGGLTRFTWVEEFDPPLGSLGDIAAERVVSPHLQSVWTKSMQNVKRLAERES
jgi:uncharacterized protein YndB with AHSA1/START domain